MGLCPVDTLHLWFPAHCAPRVIRRLHEKEQAHRAARPAWFDLPGVREELLQKHQDAKEAREMSFKIANFGTSDVLFLTCSLRVDWLSFPVQSLLERRPNLKNGVLTGIYSVKGALPWGDTKFPCTFQMTNQRMTGILQCRTFR